METKIIKFYLKTHGNVPLSNWNANANQLNEKTVNLFKDILTKTKLSEEEMTFGMDNSLISKQDAKGNVNLEKGLWEITLETLVEMQGITMLNWQSNSLHLDCKIIVDDVEINSRAKPFCSLDYYKETILVNIKNENSLLTITLSPKLYKNTTPNSQGLRQPSNEAICPSGKWPSPISFNLSNLSLIIKKIGDV